MKVNYKQLYLGLMQQKKALEKQLNPESNGASTINEIPDDFNQVGWELTIDKLEILIDKLRELKNIKGNRLTPQFYRTIYNRSLIGANEADKLIEALTTETATIDYQSEVVKLNTEIVKLQNELDKKQKSAV